MNSPMTWVERTKSSKTMSLLDPRASNCSSLLRKRAFSPLQIGVNTPCSVQSAKNPVSPRKNLIPGFVYDWPATAIHYKSHNQLTYWSERGDSNSRPPQPHCGALPSCATLRKRDAHARWACCVCQFENGPIRPRAIAGWHRVPRAAHGSVVDRFPWLFQAHRHLLPDAGAHRRW